MCVELQERPDTSTTRTQSTPRYFHKPAYHQFSWLNMRALNS